MGTLIQLYFASSISNLISLIIDQDFVQIGAGKTLKCLVLIFFVICIGKFHGVSVPPVSFLPILSTTSIGFSNLVRELVSFEL